MKTCKKCGETKHLTEFYQRVRTTGRTTYGPRCKACERERAKNHRFNNLDRYKEYDKKRYENNRDEINKQSRAWYYKNHDYALQKRKEWYQSNKQHVRKMERLYEKRVRKATPNCLTSEQRAQIRGVYALARECTTLTGDLYHVDHIVPLKHRLVCGLHVPANLQVVPQDINDSKGNTFHEVWS